MAKKKKMVKVETKSSANSKNVFCKDSKIWIKDFMSQGAALKVSDPLKLEAILLDVADKLSTEIECSSHSEGVFKEHILVPSLIEYFMGDDFNKSGLYIHRIDENGRRHITPLEELPDRDSVLSLVDEYLMEFTDLPDLDLGIYDEDDPMD